MQHFLIFSILLFAIGLTGMFINRRNIIVLLMCIELILLAANTNFIFFAKYWGDVTGQAVVFFVMTVAAAEAAIGLALVVLVFREKHTINIEHLDQLKG